MIEFKLKGTDELMKKLDEFPAKVQRKIVRGAVTKANYVLLKEVKQRAPKGLTGRLAKDLRAKTILFKTKVVGQVTTTGGHGFVGLFNEFGTAAHQIPLSGERKTMYIGNGKFRVGPFSHPGIPAKPFMRPAMEAKATELINIIAGEIADKIGFVFNNDSYPNTEGDVYESLGYDLGSSIRDIFSGDGE